MKSVVTLKKANSNAHVTVDLSLVKSSTLSIKSSLQETSNCILVSNDLQFSWQAVEAASFSGVFFALRKFNDENYFITVNNVHGKIDTGDLTMCATASCIAVLYVIVSNYKEAIADNMLSGWFVAEHAVTGSLIASN